MKITHVNSDTIKGHIVTLTRKDIAELIGSLCSCLASKDNNSYRKEFYDQKGQYLTFLVDFDDEVKELEAIVNTFTSVLDLVPRTRAERLRDYVVFPPMGHPLSRALDEYLKDRLNKPFRKLKVEQEEDQ